MGFGVIARPRIYLRTLPAPDGARAYVLTLAPLAKWDGSEVKPARVLPCAGILARFTRYLSRLVAREGAKS